MGSQLSNEPFLANGTRPSLLVLTYQFFRIILEINKGFSGLTEEPGSSRIAACGNLYLEIGTVQRCLLSAPLHLRKSFSSYGAWLSYSSRTDLLITVEL